MPALESVNLTKRLQITFVAATALLIWRLRRIYGGEALRFLAIGWSFWTVRLAVSIAITFAMTSDMPLHAPGRRFLTSVGLFLSVATAAYMQAGTLGVAGMTQAPQTRRRILAFALALAVFAGLTTFEGAPLWWRVALVVFSSTLVLVLLFGYMGWRLLRASRDDLTAGRQLAAAAYLVFAGKQLFNTVTYLWEASPSASPSPYAETISYALVAMGTVALLLERERQRAVQAEREQRRLEGELAARDRLDSLGRLAGGVAHDFNNMLTGILGNAQIARGRLEATRAGGPPEDVDEELSHIEETATRASALTKQLLAFARRDRIAPVAFDVSAAVERARGYVAAQLAPTVRLTVDRTPGDLFASGDPDRIEQAVINLVKNAEDALGGQSGRIGVTLDTVAGALDEGDAVRIRVSDTGVGMSDDVRAHLFEPFFTTKPQAHGSGLGLSIVHGAVTQAGGRIEVESAPGLGTVITLLLPRAERPAAPAAAAAVPADDLLGVRALVVDDDPLVRRVAARVLEKHGLRVLEAGDVDEALAVHAAQASETPVQVLVTDLVMPGANGRTLARMLRERDPGLRVVYMSGYEADTFTDEPDAPAGPFVPKPFRNEALLAAVREALLERAAVA